MKNLMIFLLFCFWCLCSNNIWAQNSEAKTSEKFTISGHIKDAANGEELIGATVLLGTGEGNVTNVYGYYSLTLDAGNYDLTYSFLGYEDQVKTIFLDKDISIDIELGQAGYVVEEIIISAEEKDQNVSSIEMSKVAVDIGTVKKIPALFGEVDVIKALILLPGVKAINEGGSGFYVRGGNADQNLVLLDEAPIYNASHLLGFFSSFNPDAIKDMQLYKGAMPAKYGGRLSSVLDIRMKDGNSKEFAGSAGIGSIMSRLSLEAPLGNKGSFIVSGRRSYLDVMAKAYLKAKGTYNDNKFKGYFYDLNAKGNYRINENNRVFLSGYYGQDVLEEDRVGVGVNWGNQTSTLRWNHIFNPKLFSNLTAYYSNYNYGLVSDAGIEVLDWKAKLQEYSIKTDFTAFVSPSFSVDFGAQAIKHVINPGNIRLFGEGDSLIIDFKVDEVASLENAVYGSASWKVNETIEVEGGLRFSSLHSLGPATHYQTDTEAIITDSIRYEKDFYHTHINAEPRIGLKIGLNKSSSIKASYNRTAQYIQQASNGNTSTPFDIWFTASPMVKPQLADQVSLGYFRNFNDNTYEFSVETYYKSFKDAIDFREGASLLLNKNLEGELRFGQAKAYGAEFFLQKNKGKLTGWISCTYSKIEKQIETINSGDWYNAKYDKPHDLSIVATYDLTKRLRLSSNFVYSTGSAVTFPTGKYEYFGTVVPLYSERNAERLPDYHRLDFSMILQSKKNETRKRQAEWVLGIYNVYNRKNAFAVNFRQDGARTFAEKSAIFSIVPSITYNLKF